MRISLAELAAVIRIVLAWEQTHGRAITADELARELGLIL